MNGVKSCPESPTIQESILHDAIMNAVQKIVADNGEFIEAFRQNVIQVIGKKSHGEERDEYDELIKEKEKEIVALISENAVTREYN